MINATLPRDVFDSIRSGEKRWIAHRKNPRVNRYFRSKKPTNAKINGIVFRISRVEETPTDWVIHL